MFRPSPRDLSLISGLLPLFSREITADPEQHDRARREARIRGYQDIGKYVNHTKAEAERKRDDALRVKLDGESEPFSKLTMTDDPRRERCWPIPTTLRSCCTANITDCTQIKAYRETLCLGNCDKDRRRDRTHALPCGHPRSRSVNRTVSIP
jgi:hypothetical protein